MTQQSTQIPISPGGWQFQQPPLHPQHQFNFGGQQPFVQPHINPRFASQFGMNFGLMQPQLYPQYGLGPNNTSGSHSGGNWADEWIVHGRDTSGYRAGGDDTGTGDVSAGT
jgi:H/ACA ribonucleoprotein complex non-core subunit NAF1